MLLGLIRVTTALLISLSINLVFCDDFCDFRCLEDGTCINASDVCSGLPQCRYGSDELFVTCKDYENDPNEISCASGSQITEAGLCNTNVDCYDKSDESATVCSSKYDIQKSPNKTECISNKTIPNEYICDGKFDCFNGWDESAENCMKFCNSFQCGNGECIDNELVCNNKHDCIDGSDELNRICEKLGKSDWIEKPQVVCQEPRSEGLQFSQSTPNYSFNGMRVVYPSQSVHFECSNKLCELVGNPWNVCNTSSQWHFDMPSCKCSWFNNDRNTNGVNGCPINTYAKYKNQLRIYKCDNNNTNNCTKKVYPPINDMTVKYACESDYYLYPEYKKDWPFKCINKKWSELSVHTDPKCLKKCNTEFLYCRDSMEPVCRFDKLTIACNRSEGLEAGTEVTFHCRQGFRSIEGGDSEKLTLNCEEDGTWTQSSSMDKCEIGCGINNNKMENSWTVALFMKSQNSDVFNYGCAGVLIRHNLVLTAAHCVCANHTATEIANDLIRVGPPNSIHSSVRRDFGWSVSAIKVSSYYEPSTFQSDLAIIRIDNEQLYFGTICLKFSTASTENGAIHLWDTRYMMRTGRLRKKENNVNVSRLRETDFRIETFSTGTVCRGNSGSGFVQSENGISYLYGIVSSKKANENGCTKDVTIVNTTHDSSIEFIKETIELYSNTCDDLD